ncbi:hypothetical protein [Actinomadura sp. 3N407]|uniref:hypothetical protein n=1 Tax=Actinomadura sp. 3N407 TaxID=3457423 RepID=UPI003FCC8DB3
MAKRCGVGCWLVTFAASVGWCATAVACVPAAWFLGIWLSGWEDPGPGIIQGASKNPLYSGAGFAMALSYVVLLALTTVLWGLLIKRIITRHDR